MARIARFGLFWLVLTCLTGFFAQAQQTLGSINGTVSDVSGGVLGKVTVKVHNVETNLEQTTVTKDDGSFLIVGLPIGKYAVSFSRDGFKTEVHDQILVPGGLTNTVNGALQLGSPRFLQMALHLTF